VDVRAIVTGVGLGLGAVAVLLVWEWLDRRRAEKESCKRAEQLLRAPLDELVREAHRAARFCGWERFHEAEALLDGDAEWTEDRLLQVIGDLYRSIALRDDDQHYFFYDGGLASLCEALEARVAADELRSSR
jgi:hypothetical protein